MKKSSLLPRLLTPDELAKWLEEKRKARLRMKRMAEEEEEHKDRHPEEAPHMAGARPLGSGAKANPPQLRQSGGKMRGKEAPKPPQAKKLKKREVRSPWIEGS